MKSMHYSLQAKKSELGGFFLCSLGPQYAKSGGKAKVTV